MEANATATRRRDRKRGRALPERRYGTLRFHRSTAVAPRRVALHVAGATPAASTPAARPALRVEQNDGSPVATFTLEDLTRAVEHVAAHFDGAPPDDFLILGLRSYAYAIWVSLNDPTGRTLRRS